MNSTHCLQKLFLKTVLVLKTFLTWTKQGSSYLTRCEQVIVEKGSKRVPQPSLGEKGETVSIVACCSVTGVFLPPLFIFKGIRRREELGDGLPVGAEFYMTKSGFA